MQLLLGVAFYYRNVAMDNRVNGIYDVAVYVYELVWMQVCNVYGFFQMALLKYSKKKDHALPVVSPSYARLLFQFRVDLSQAKYLLHITAANSVEIVNVSIFLA